MLPPPIAFYIQTLLAIHNQNKTRFQNRNSFIYIHPNIYKEAHYFPNEMAT